MAPLEPRMRREHRVARRQIIVLADLVLVTPTHLGNGDTEGVTDMALVVDAVSQQALLTGASLVGALRAYILTRQHGYNVAEQQATAPNGHLQLDDAELLFGGRKGDDDGTQSPLILHELAEGSTRSAQQMDNHVWSCATGSALIRTPAPQPRPRSMIWRC